MARPDPDVPLPVADLSLDFIKASFMWFKYRDPYDDGFFLSYASADRNFKAFHYECPTIDPGDNKIVYASHEDCEQLRAMLNPEQVAMCVSASLQWAG